MPSLERIAREDGVTAASLRLVSLTTGELVLTGLNLSASQLRKLETELISDREFFYKTISWFAMNPKAQIEMELSAQDRERPAQVFLRARAKTPVPLVASAGEALRTGPMSFEGKHGFPWFERTMFELRKKWQREFRSEDWAPVGIESQFGTILENAQKLVGHRVAFIGIKIQRIISEPLKAATIHAIEGTVLEIRDIKDGGIDPVWEAKIKTREGQIITANLTDAIGLHVARSPGLRLEELTGREAYIREVRRKTAFLEFKQEYGRLSSGPSARTSVRERMLQSPPELRERLGELRRRLISLFAGRGTPGIDPRIEFLNRQERDHALRPLAKLKNEKFRPLVEEIQRILYDTEGPHGFNRWFADFVIEICLDAQAAGRLHWGLRNPVLRDPHDNYPFAEGAHGIEATLLRLRELPQVFEIDMMKAIDRRIELYGYGKNLPNIPGLRIAPGSKYLTTLHGMNLKETTHFFVEYSKNNLLFQDTYFIGKPHGQYSHVFQWLYVAERLSQPDQNRFGRNMLEVLMEIQPYFMEDFPTSVRATDFVGQRAPQNPDHINNLLRLIFPVD
ncbi:MAG TPA: hypothetical protein VFV50_10340 [Bdellovibrionales bacterium]|nr:hypothetical protein [Bdellovibrionales bacterium]